MLRILLTLVLCCTINGLEAESIPPSVDVQPAPVVYFKFGEFVELPCVASGSPSIEYTWKRNGVAFTPSGNSDRVVQLSNNGTLVFYKPEDKDEGIFQCFASNKFGTSATIKINFREAMLKQFQNSVAIAHRPLLGYPLTLDCVPPESIPQAKVFWVIKDPEGGIDVIKYDARVTMDHESRLRFTNVIASDRKGGRAYACMAYNSFVRSNSQGPEQFIIPQGDNQTLQPVRSLWASPLDHFGWLGDLFTIKCIFSGNPTPVVNWTRSDGKPLPDNVNKTSFGQELTFDKLEMSDEAVYECWGSNKDMQTSVQRSISVRVESRPYWLEEPADVDLGVGATARFQCHGADIPKPDVFWFINAVPLESVTDPRIDKRFNRISTDEIIFENVTLNDDMVIQCNVTNKHGYIWGDVYLNVHKCSEGTYGKNCSICGFCADGKACHVISGQCSDGCKPGWTGDKCDAECPKGTNATNCTAEGSCAVGEDCQSISGAFVSQELNWKTGVIIALSVYCWLQNRLNNPFNMAI